MKTSTQDKPRLTTSAMIASIADDGQRSKAAPFGKALVELARNRVVPVIGLNYKDKPQEAKAWLKQFGNPYMLSVTDLDGRVGIDYGVYGVPETFVIDRTGVIRYKQIGPVTKESLEGKILPLVRQLQKS